MGSTLNKKGLSGESKVNHDHKEEIKSITLHEEILYIFLQRE